MDFKEFKELFDSDKHALSDLIKEGEIPFDLCLEANGRMVLPKLLLVSMLVHPDCDKIFFKLNYYNIIMKAGTVARHSILPFAKALRFLECIQVVVSSDEPTVESIMDAYQTGNARESFLLLIKNPYIPVELKNKLFDVTGDESLLSTEAKDIFIF